MLRQLLFSLVLVTLACNPRADFTPQPTPSPVASEVGEKEMVARFLLGGWVVPRGEDAEAAPFAETLKAFVITKDEELRDFLDRVNLVRLRGNLDSLNRADLGQVVVLAVYYLWRPLKGDPLSIKRTALKGNEVEISLELLEDPQGRERPYLVAPLHVVSLERKDLTQGVPLRFVFLVNGKVAATQTLTLE